MAERKPPRLQCSHCPWKAGADPHQIPGYRVRKHEALAEMIAEPGSTDGVGAPVQIMACHETHDLPCVGWLENQLGPGNNMPLRMLARAGSVDVNVQTVGPQRERFEDTLPRRRRAR